MDKGHVSFYLHVPCTDHLHLYVSIITSETTKSSHTSWIFIYKNYIRESSSPIDYLFISCNAELLGMKIITSVTKCVYAYGILFGRNIHTRQRVVMYLLEEAEEEEEDFYLIMPI